MDIGPSKSILDQVDEYLHDANDIIHNHNESNPTNNGNLSLEEELKSKQNIHNSTNHNADTGMNANNSKHNTNEPPWLSDSIQINLDQISRSLYKDGHDEGMFRDDNNHNNALNGHSIVPPNIMTGLHEFVDTDIANGVNQDYYDLYDPPQRHHQHTDSNSSNYNNKNNYEMSNMLKLPTNTLFSPNASPLIAPNQASVGGMQVTPFMQPLTLKHDFDKIRIPNAVINNNDKDFLGAPVSILESNLKGKSPADESQFEQSVNGNSTGHSISDSKSDNNFGNNGILSIKHEDLLSDFSNYNKNNTSSNTADIDMSEMAPLTRSNTTGSTPRNNNGNNSKRNHSSVVQTSSRSDSNSKVVKNSPYLKANRSRRRFSRGGRTSLENTPILASTNVLNGSLQMTTSNNSEDTVFQLPDSSVSSGNVTPVTAQPVAYTDNSNGNAFNGDVVKDEENSTSASSSATITDNFKKDSDDKTGPGKRPRSRSRVTRFKDDSKKEIHKVAEQERRNRLNSALTELGSLIPEDLKKTVNIPSKATTAELACIYIRQLQDALAARERH